MYVKEKLTSSLKIFALRHILRRSYYLSLGCVWQRKETERKEVEREEIEWIFIFYKYAWRMKGK